jgi:hypothetical protein
MFMTFYLKLGTMDLSLGQGYQAQNVDAIRAERIVCTVRAAELRVKAFQVVFHKDGSFFISFPYFRHRIGLLSISSIPANGSRESQVNLEHGGKVTSHLVKYSHHVDGRAHFSQDGKIFTTIKRQSIALQKQHGHIFSLLIQGLNALDPAKDELQSTKRAAIEFAMEPPAAVKFVGRWFDVNAMRFSNPTPTIGPVVPGLDPDGKRADQIFRASPFANAHHVLAISCIPIPALGSEQEIFVFYGGFSSPDIMTDPTKEAGFLAFMYPLVDSEKLRDRLGSVDFLPK